MSTSSWAKFDTHGYLNVYDGTGTPVSITRIPYIEGDVKFGGIEPICNQVVKATVRGVLMGVGYGEPTFPTVSLSERVTDLIAAAAPGPAHDFFMFTGAYSANVSTFGSGKPRAMHLEFVQKGAAFGDPDGTMKLWNVMFKGYDLAWGKPNTRTWTGEVMGIPGAWGGSVGGAGTVVSINGVIEARRIDQDGN